MGDLFSAASFNPSAKMEGCSSPGSNLPCQAAQWPSVPTLLCSALPSPDTDITHCRQQIFPVELRSVSGSTVISRTGDKDNLNLSPSPPPPGQPQGFLTCLGKLFLSQNTEPHQPEWQRWAEPLEKPACASHLTVLRLCTVHIST